MQHLERAIEIGAGLKAALEAEVVRAQGERVLVRQFDVDGLFKRATQREAFNAEVVRLQQALATELREIARYHGLEQVTLESLGALAPEPAGRLSAVLAEVRALAGALAELDDLNRKLAHRASACVKGYLQALSIRTSGYDRRGAVAPAASSTFSRSV
jgi:hypothetical protein